MTDSYRVTLESLDALYATFQAPTQIVFRMPRDIWVKAGRPLDLTLDIS